MHNRAFMKVALLGLLTLVLVPGLAAASSQGPEMLASTAAERAVAVSGPIISVAPLANNYGIVNVGSSAMFTFTVQNTGDMPLNILSAVSSDLQFAGAFGSLTVAPGGMTTMDVTYTPSSGAAASASVTVMSDASNGPYAVSVAGRGNTAPYFNPPLTDKAGFAFVALVFDTPATDAEGDPVTYGVIGLPVGATYLGGHFEWMPGVADAGTHPVTFTVTDGYASSSQSIVITITASNHPPVANPGGPYQGAVSQPVQFNGSGSSDPDGNALTFAWNFGDSHTGTGMNPQHTYLGAGSYLVTLTVTDNGTPPLSNSATTSATIQNYIPVKLLFKAAIDSTTMLPMVKTQGGGTQVVGLEPGTSAPSDIDPATVQLTATVCGTTVINALPPSKSTKIGDLNANGIPDLDVSFNRSDIRALLGCVAAGTQVTVTVQARTLASKGALPVLGSAKVEVVKGGHAVSAFAAPNPFNPETSISYSLRDNGMASVRIYSLAGRLVRTLEEGYATAGTHEVRWNGRDDRNTEMASGMYFVQVRQGADSAIYKLVLAK